MRIYEQESNDNLAIKLKNGDDKAFEELYIRYFDKLSDFIGKILKNYSTVKTSEDIVQEAFRNTYTKIHKYTRKKGNISTWIYTLAQNLAFTELRKMKRRNETPMSNVKTKTGEFDGDVKLEEAVGNGELGSDELLEKRLNEHRIYKILENTPRQFRTAIIMRDIQDLDYNTMSNILDIPLGTVKSRINRGRIYIQEEFKKYNQ
ncbi:MAG: sigma-70 family RNA polymerase sigma factor [archaeon]